MSLPRKLTKPIPPPKSTRLTLLICLLLSLGFAIVFHPWLGVGFVTGAGAALALKAAAELDDRVWLDRVFGGEQG